jgi:hypothetical protein
MSLKWLVRFFALSALLVITAGTITGIREAFRLGREYDERFLAANGIAWHPTSAAGPAPDWMPERAAVPRISPRAARIFDTVEQFNDDGTRRAVWIPKNGVS